ncbi:MAG: tRNA adenosine(34) deaminase TadA [Desulfobulbaceae bacterium]|nr:tRNA adenosine(34) deaminase TadA [Desulfobulbaceae bacterium]
MEMALVEARQVARRGEVPVGAVVVDQAGQVLGRSGNRPIELHDPSAHAEMLAMRQAAAALGNYRLTGCTVYVTLEPCPMCAGAMVNARLAKVVFGAEDPKGGGMVSRYRIGSDGLLNHALAFEGGLLAEESAKLLRDFFRERRNGNIAG